MEDDCQKDAERDNKLEAAGKDAIDACVDRCEDLFKFDKNEIKIFDNDNGGRPFPDNDDICDEMLDVEVRSCNKACPDLCFGGDDMVSEVCPNLINKWFGGDNSNCQSDCEDIEREFSSCVTCSTVRQRQETVFAQTCSKYFAAAHCFERENLGALEDTCSETVANTVRFAERSSCDFCEAPFDNDDDGESIVYADEMGQVCVNSILRDAQAQYAQICAQATNPASCRATFNAQLGNCFVCFMSSRWLTHCFFCKYRNRFRSRRLRVCGSEHNLQRCCGR